MFVPIHMILLYYYTRLYSIGIRVIMFASVARSSGNHKDADGQDTGLGQHRSGYCGGANNVWLEI